MAERQVEIPKGAKVTLSSDTITVEGNGKKIEKLLDLRSVGLEIGDGKVIVKSVDEKKKSTQTAGTIAAIIKNMVLGTTQEFSYKLKVEHKHFPLKGTVKGDSVEIGNYLGTKSNRYAKIVQGAKVDVKGADITVKSNDKNAAGQTAANIEKASKPARLCDRKFLDGIYIVEKP